MRKWQESTARFMQLAKQQVRTSPCLPSGPERVRIAKLLLEETMETIAGLGVDAFVEHPGAGPIRVDRGKTFCVIGNEMPSLVEVADGVADTIYVALGAANACGVDMEPVCEAIWKNNIDKFGPGSSIDASGKLIKPEGFVGPDVAGLLAIQAKN